MDALVTLMGMYMSEGKVLRDCNRPLTPGKGMHEEEEDIIYNIVTYSPTISV